MQSPFSVGHFWDPKDFLGLEIFSVTITWVGLKYTDFLSGLIMMNIRHNPR